MRTKRGSILSPILLALFAAATAFGQISNFSDPNVDYSFDIPDERWKMTLKPSPAKPNVEYVFIDRNDGHLEIRKLALAKDAVISDILRDEELKLQFLPGFVAGKEENFNGRLRGTIYNFEFVRAGRPMAGRFYFLRADDSTLYVLRFQGYRDRLRSIRNQTDSMARTFVISTGKS
ncbi:MAG TPA: hypothetical protein VJV05_07660 [Pyrinomonadaceae bacterium]|nr:hypothetical protein [Pyrinomonadaceae bacterium]